MNPEIVSQVKEIVVQSGAFEQLITSCKIDATVAVVVGFALAALAIFGGRYVVKQWCHENADRILAKVVSAFLFALGLIPTIAGVTTLVKLHVAPVAMALRELLH